MLSDELTSADAFGGHRAAPDRHSAGAGGHGTAAAPRPSRLVDIARAVGVHTSTVSRVLNGDPAQSVRPETYQQIIRTARQQGYRPNVLARALKRRRTGGFAFVVPLLRNPIWVRLPRGESAPPPASAWRYSTRPPRRRAVGMRREGCCAARPVLPRAR